MFGRSGQMFPRRTYHDAIYEEEYGSETEEECCRGRGLSAILCWFLSVVVLIGLAASVVLTVFFILKSRNALAKNNQEDFNPDLNFVLDHGNGFKITPTTTDYNLNYSSSNKVPVGLGNAEAPMTTTFVETRTTSMTTTTTKLPPTTRLTTRKYWSDTTGDPFGDYNQKTTAMPSSTTDANSVFKILFNSIKTFNDSPQYGESVEQPPIDEVISNESVERFVPHPPPPTTSSPTPSSYLPTTARTMTSTSPILFTLPPNTSTLGQFNKKSTTTRFPERTSFSSEDTSATTYQQQYDQTKHYSPASVSSSEEMETTSEVSTTFKPPFEEEPYQDEDSLKKMLIDQIPPHRDTPDIISTTTTTSAPTTVITEDLLAKIIKNLQPKWNKTTKDTSGSSSGPARTRNRYVELDRNSTEYKSGNFKVKRVKVRVTTTVPPTTVIFITPDKPETTLQATDSHSADSSESVTNIHKRPTLSPNQGIEMIQSPDLGQKETHDRDINQKDNAFLDILVGSDDHKTLITKETDAGIITSAILPPWYDTSSNSTDTMELSNHTLKFTKTDILDEDDDNNDHSKPKSDFDILLNLFSNSPLPNEGEKSGYPKSETYIPEQAPEESSRKTHLKNLEEQFKPFFGTAPEDSNPTGTSGTSGTQKVSPANTAFHYGSTDGTTHIFGYYPEEDLDEGESVDQLDIEIDANNKRRNGRNESNEELLNNSGSHVIDIAFDPKAQPEIVIEPDDADGEADEAEYSDNDNYSDIVEPIAAGSDIQNHQVYAQPPKNLQPSSGPSDHIGGGIRRPMNDEDGDLYPAATEPKLQQSDWSTKQTGNPGLPTNNDELPEEYLEEFSEELQDEDKPLEDYPNKNEKDTTYSSEFTSNAGDHVLERKPMLNVEDSVIPNNNKDDSSTTTTTTVKPRVRVYEVYSEPFRTTTQPPDTPTTEKPDVTLQSEESSESVKNKSGFIAPTPISFHENHFSLTNTNPDFVSRDGWRPVMYDRPGGGKNPQNKHSTLAASNEQYFLSTSIQPPPFSSSPVLQITTPIRSPVTTPSNPNMSPPDEYEDEGSNPTSNEQWYNDQSGGGDEDNRESESNVKIKPSMQIPMPPANNPPRVKFPVNENQQQQQQHVLNRQPLIRPQHQNAQANNMQNNFIDRTKYMHRPARPPILMRRKPPFNLPFANRKRIGNKTQMISSNMSNRNFPRGPFQAAGSNGPVTGPFQQHPNENPNVPVVRNRQDFIPNPHLPQGGVHPPPGNVRWPADDNFIRRNNNNMPPHMNRRPMG